jgi:hypothetical protein
MFGVQPGAKYAAWRGWRNGGGWPQLWLAVAGMAYRIRLMKS